VICPALVRFELRVLRANRHVHFVRSGGTGCV